MMEQREPVEGDFVAAWVIGEGGTFKRYYRDNNTVILRPDNTKEHEKIKRPADRVRIQGVFVEMVRRKEKIKTL